MLNQNRVHEPSPQKQKNKDNKMTKQLLTSIAVVEHGTCFADFIEDRICSNSGQTNLCSSGGAIDRGLLFTDAGTKNYLFIEKPLYGNLITWDQSPPSYGGINSIKPDLDTWYHVAVVEDSTYRAIYINGSLDISDNISDDTIRIGSRADSTPFYFDGTIDDVRIYNRALSAQEIQQLYQNSLAGL